MAAPLILRIIGDATSYFKTADETVAANTKIADSALRIGASSEKSASAQVAAAERAIRAQRAQLASLQAIARDSALGSDRRVAATVAIAQAQAKLDRQMGVTAVATRGSGAAAKEAERDFGKLTRGALAGSGVFAALGRSLAFASGGFLAVAGGATLLHNAISAALELAATQRSVNTQLGTSGKTWEEYGKRIDAVDLKLSHVSGFTNQELLQSFGYLVRVTGNVSEALKLNAVAADVARGRHISLSAASIALSKALGGSETALRRLGITIPKNLDRMQALTYVQQKFAGQAQASATTADRFHASLVDTEEIVGTALLPTFDRLTNHLSAWLAKSNESGRIQRDANKAVKIAGDLFHSLGTAIGIVDRVTGSFENTIKTLLALKLIGYVASAISKLKELSLAWQAVAASAKGAAAAEATAGEFGVGSSLATGAAGAAGIGAAAAGAARGRAVLSSREAAVTNNAINKSLGRDVEASVAKGLEAGVAGGAAVAATKLGGLKNLLYGLASKPIAIAIALTFIPPSRKGKDFLDKIGLGFLGKLPILGPLDTQVAHLEQGFLNLNNKLRNITHGIVGLPLPSGSTRGLGPLTPDTAVTLRSGNAAASLIVGSGEAEQFLRLAGATGLPQNPSAKQEVRAAKELNAAAKRSAKIAKQVRDAIILINDAHAQLTAGLPQNAVITKQFRNFPYTGNALPPALQLPGLLGQPLPGFTPTHRPGPIVPKTPPTGFDVGVKPITIWAAYKETIAEQVAAAQAALTKSTKDDVSSAKAIIRRIKRLIDEGHLSGNSLIQALQDEATQQGILDSARQAAAQRAAQIAAAKKQAASSYETPIDLQIAEVRAQLTSSTRDDIQVELQIIAAAKAALASGKKNKQGQLAALSAELQAQQALDSLRNQSATSYALPLRLQLQLARAQAQGTDQTPILQRMKKALERALKAAKGNIQKQIDIWNQITQINQQLGTNVQNAYGDYKKASLKWETQGLGLTPAERRALEARLSQIGPGGTHPMAGTGAAGYAIDPDTGRPIHRGHRRGSNYSGGESGVRPPTVNANIDLSVYIDGRQVEAVVTKRQQRNNGRRPTQRRGPNAATR